MRNTFDRAGAETLLRQIQDYWAERGQTVEGHIVRCGFDERVRAARYEVITDLVNGLPAGYSRKDVSRNQRVA